MKASVQSPNATIYFLKRDSSEKNEQINIFLDYTKSFLTSDRSVKDEMDHDLLKKFYEFRMLLIEWLRNNYIYSIPDLLDETNQKFSSYFDTNLKEMNENVLFAISSIFKVVIALIESNSIKAEDLKIENIPTREKDYDEIINIILDNTPSETAAINIKFNNCNLLLDFLTLCSLMINEKMAIVSKKTIEEISDSLADIASDYMRYAYELGILKFNKKTTKALNEAKAFMNS